MNSYEEDCPRCEAGVLEHSFVLNGREPDVGRMQGWAEYDGTRPCSECGFAPEYRDDEVAALEEEAFDRLLMP